MDYDGTQYWSDVISIIPHEENNIDLQLELLADLTHDPNPDRFDGVPPVYEPEKIMVASLGSIRGLLVQSVVGQTTGDQKIYFFINDHLGTPQKLLNENAGVVWSADYKPFGEADVYVNTFENRFRFPGQYYDTETGLHYNFFRYYDPSTGRYLTPDPIGLAGGINLFSYVSNNPVNFLDPLGLEVLGPGMINNFVPESTLHYSNTNIGGSILFTDYSTQLHSSDGGLFPITQTSLGVSTSLIGGGAQFVFTASDISGWNALGNSAMTFGMGRYLGVSIYPATGQISLNIGLGVAPIVSVSMKIDTVDHNCN